MIIFLSTYWELWFLLMHLIVIAYNTMIKRRVGDWSAHPYLWAKHLTIIMLNSERLYTENYAFGESNGNPLQYSCLGNTMDRGAWWTTVHGVAKSWTWLSDFTEFHFSLSWTGEDNGNPLQYSCLENPRDGGAWWAAVYGVEQSRTLLTRLSSSSSSSSSTIEKNKEKNKDLSF